MIVADYKYEIVYVHLHIHMYHGDMQVILLSDYIYKNIEVDGKIHDGALNGHDIWILIDLLDGFESYVYDHDNSEIMQVDIEC